MNFLSDLKSTKSICFYLLSGILLFQVPASANEFDTLSGPLPKTVPAGNKPYLIVSDIEVSFGKKVTIEPGAVFLFQNFTGFHVEGQLIAEGTKAKPIIFTSEFDGEHSPDTTQIANPFDWNGIYIHKDAFGSRIKFGKIMNSVYGIRSETRLIRIDPCIFFRNGKGHLAILDSLHPVIDKAPYTYVLSSRDATIEGVSIKLVKDPQSRKRNFFRYTSITLLAGGIGAAIYGYERYDKSKNKFDDISSDNVENLNRHTAKDWEYAKRDKNLDFTLLSAGITASVLGAVGLTWTFTF
jgi:hypothetical protein